MQDGASWVARLGAVLIVGAFILPGHTRAAAVDAHVRRAALNVFVPQTAQRSSVPSRSVLSGSHITVVAAHLPRAASTFCVGLVSLIDQGGLPINLGRLRGSGVHAGRLETRIPRGLIGPEPAGPYLLFIGDCTRPAPMGDYGSTQITIPR